MTCPSCGSPGAYVGLAVVECDREGCEKYKGAATVSGDLYAIASTLGHVTRLRVYAVARRYESALPAAMRCLVYATFRCEPGSDFRFDADGVARPCKPGETAHGYILHAFLAENDEAAMAVLKTWTDDQPNPGATAPAGNSSTTGPS